MQSSKCSILSATISVQHTTITKEDHVYKVNVTYLQDLHAVYGVSVDSRLGRMISPKYTSTIEVTDANNSLVITGLGEFTLHEVTMWAENSIGSSLPTYSILVATQPKDQKTVQSGQSAPVLPDIRSCCISSNVTHAPCVDKFCDPHSLAFVEQTDLMICAPWDSEIFSCLADGRDHTPCCIARQVPPACHKMCSGKVDDLSLENFLCLKYMDQLSSCMLQGYGVLPSSPVNFRYSNLHSDWGILHWDPPALRAQTVTGYVAVWKKAYSNESLHFKVNVRSPFILEDLDPESTYEVYVEPQNEHGLGETSSRIVFRTPVSLPEHPQDPGFSYNHTECCESVGVSSECLPLCDYNVTLTTVTRLAAPCRQELGSMVRCGAGGRDHDPCCRRRGVPDSCLQLCQGQHSSPYSKSNYLSCLSYIGQVVQCWEEGTLLLPAQVYNLKAIDVQDDLVFLAWEDAHFNNQEGANTDRYQVIYSQVPSLGANESTLFSSVPFVKISGLKQDQLYQFTVIAINSHGSSLPSSIVTVRASKESWEGSSVHGAPSPPHSLRVSYISVTSLQLSWDPPTVAPLGYPLTYTLYYRAATDLQYRNQTSELPTVTVTGLKSGSLYVCHVIGVSLGPDGEMHGSARSEELSVWTDSVMPPMVSVRVVRDRLRQQGSISNIILRALFVHELESKQTLLTQVDEGDSMTVLCLAQGTPNPTVSMFAGGIKMMTKKTRHMSVVFHNVTRNMSKLTCLADNGYGTAEDVKIVTIRTAPDVTVPITSTVLEGDDLQVRCVATAVPVPTLYISRSPDWSGSAVSGSRITTNATKFSASSIHITLNIKNVTTQDAGLYYCHANNSLGRSSAPMSVNVTSIPNPVLDVLACCKEHNVPSDCWPVCSSAIDLDWFSIAPQCMTEFHKVIACAADGSDHRQCCTKRGVPAETLDWCRGVTKAEGNVLALNFSQDIVSCYHQGNGDLPGPPRDVRVRQLDSSRAVLFWDLPAKNPDRIEMYRLYWNVVGDNVVRKADVTQRSVILPYLEPGKRYEVAIKAGNSNGSSPLTQPLQFVFNDFPNITDSVTASTSSTNPFNSTTSTSIATTSTFHIETPATSTTSSPPSSSSTSTTTSATATTSVVPLNASATSSPSSRPSSPVILAIPIFFAILLTVILVLLIVNSMRRARLHTTSMEEISATTVAFENPGYFVEPSSIQEATVEIRNLSPTRSPSSGPSASSSPILEPFAEDSCLSPNRSMMDFLADNTRTAPKGFSRF